MSALLTLEAYAPSGDAAFYTVAGQLWLTQYPKARRSDRRELARAVAEGFVRCDEPLHSHEELADRLDALRAKWLEQLPPAQDYLSQYSAETVWRMLETLEANVGEGRSKASTLRKFAATMLLGCPAARADDDLHERLVRILTGDAERPTPDELPGPEVEPAVMARLHLPLAAG